MTLGKTSIDEAFEPQRVLHRNIAKFDVAVDHARLLFPAGLERTDVLDRGVEERMKPQVQHIALAAQCGARVQLGAVRVQVATIRAHSSASCRLTTSTLRLSAALRAVTSPCENTVRPWRSTIGHGKARHLTARMARMARPRPNV